MRKALVLVLLLVVAGTVGVARAKADASASISVWAESGENATGSSANAIDQQASDDEPGTSASAAWGWPLQLPFPDTPCDPSGCNGREGGATASVDEAAGTLKAGAGAVVYAGNAPDANYGADAYVQSSASFSDTITLSKPATVILEGTVHGSMMDTNASDYWLNDPSAGAEVSLDFDLGGGPIFAAPTMGGATPSGYDANYSPETTVVCSDAANDCPAAEPGDPSRTAPIDDSFSVPVDLPAGTTGISGSIGETVNLLVDGEPNILLFQDGLTNLGDTLTFHVVVPDDVVATSGSGELPIVGGAGPADTTAPTSTATVTPAPNAVGWNDGPVTVDIAAADEAGGSGVASVTYDTGSGPQTVSGATASVPVGAEGTTTVTYFATDAAGNAEAPHTLTVRIDSTPPQIAVPAGGEVDADATGPSGAAVSYDVAVTDNLDGSPTLSCTPASGGSFPIGSTTVDCSASDAAGNSSTATFTVVVRGAEAQIAQELGTGIGPLDLLQRTVALLVARGNTRAGCRVLQAYALGVRLAGRSFGRRPAQLDAATVAAKLADVERIRAVLGC